MPESVSAILRECADVRSLRNTRIRIVLVYASRFDAPRALFQCV